jgi:Zn-dependent M28 family amino/carboxypeptidase
MRRTLIIIALAALLAAGACDEREFGTPDDTPREISRIEMQSVVEYLGSDLLEGRAPGTRGGELAEEYCRSLLKSYDIGPYGDGYFQEFTLAGFRTTDLEVEANGVTLAFLDDAVGSWTRTDPEFDITGRAVFVGFGIKSDAWDWDDYKDVDVSGKIVICRVNEPGFGDPGLFEGDNLTYYGRWTYKIEEAARRGAKAILLVHTAQSAGYGWHVVRNSWGGEELYLESELDNDLVFRGWIREEKLYDLLLPVGISLGDLLTASESREFIPVDLRFDINIKGSGESRSFKTRNVVGYIPGSDPSMSDRAILLSAHIDHLGMKDAPPGEDGIFNGAIDNGSAVAAMMLTAKLLRERQDRLGHSVIVLGCQAEEAGLLGSLYFANSLDPGKIVCNINYESSPVWGKATSLMGVGSNFSTMEDLLVGVADRMGLSYSEYFMSDRGFFYRSDQFSFARKGIPSIWISAGQDWESGVNHLYEFFVGQYHTVDDEYDPSWELESLRQTVEAAVLLVSKINAERPDIRWKGRMTFPFDEDARAIETIPPEGE